MVTGEYIISILDDDGCLYVDTINLTPIPNPLVMQTNVSHVNCYGGSDGEIGVFLDNGLLPYTFYINGFKILVPLHMIVCLLVCLKGTYYYSC